MAAALTPQAGVTIPGALNTLVSNTTGAPYLIDCQVTNPTTNSPATIFTTMQSFFNTNGTPNVTGQALTDLQTLLSNPALSNFLSSIEKKSIATWLKNVNKAIKTNSPDTQVVNAVKSAMKQKTTLGQISQLISITTGPLSNATVLVATSNTLATAIMAAGGTFIASVNKYATQTSYSAKDKTNIKKLLSTMPIL